MVCGYVVRELLGSGRSGLLYLLEHGSSGQAAVLRTIVADDAEGGAHFTEEALRFLPHSERHRLLRGKLDDGTPVELLVVPGHLRFAGLPWAARLGSRWWRAGLIALACLVLSAASVLGRAPGRELESTSAPEERAKVASVYQAANDEPCLPDPIWRQNLFYALEEVERLGNKSRPLRSLLRARRRSLVRLVTGKEPIECREVVELLRALRRELDDAARAADEGSVDFGPSTQAQNAVSSLAP